MSNTLPTIVFDNDFQFVPEPEKPARTNLDQGCDAYGIAKMTTEAGVKHVAALAGLNPELVAATWAKARSAYVERNKSGVEVCNCVGVAQFLRASGCLTRRDGC